MIKDKGSGEGFSEKFNILEKLTEKGLEQGKDQLDTGLADPRYDYSDDAWTRQTSETLCDHLVEEHLHPSNIYELGFARHDIEIAKHAGFDLSRAAEAFCSCLEEGDEVHAERIRAALLEGKLSVDEYKKAIFQTLKYMEELCGTKINWAQIDKYRPSSWDGAANPDVDSKDKPFRP